MTTTAKRLRIAARHDHSQGRMMNEAADLIEQQQREIDKKQDLDIELYGFYRRSLEERDALAAHVELLANGIDYAIEALNTEVVNLGTMRSEEIKELQAIKRTVPQTSLAEVRAKQADESFRKGVEFADGDPEWLDDLENAIRKHANKVRNGGNND